jgi:RHS repeat-associated protein
LNTFAYDGDGLRIQRQDSSGTSKQIWDGEKIVEETDQSNVAQVVYTQSTGRYGDIVSQRRSGISSYFVFDPLGSTTRLVDGNHNVTDSYLFKAFGESLLSVGTTVNVYTYVGRLGYLSDLSNQRYLATRRWIGATLGRFLTLDPIGARASDSNKYLYVTNRPVILVDPSGEQPSPLQPNYIYMRCIAACEAAFSSWWEAPLLWACTSGCSHGALALEGVSPIDVVTYGRYCGPDNEHSAVCIGHCPSPKNLPPWDVLDEACIYHDCCLATLGDVLDPWQWSKCNQALCEFAAYLLSTGGCDQSMSPTDCKRYAGEIVATCSLL